MSAPQPAFGHAWYSGIREQVRKAGFEDEIRWAEDIKPPTDAEDFVSELIFVICNSGMKAQVARGIYDKVMAALRRDGCAGTAFNHVGKVASIERLWRQRARLFAEYQRSCQKLKWLGEVPWIGPITRYHAAKNFGLEVIKPDRHLERVAKAARTSPYMLCRRLSTASGDSLAVVDTVIWRAANLGIIDTAAMVPSERRSRGAA